MLHKLGHLGRGFLRGSRRDFWVVRGEENFYPVEPQLRKAGAVASSDLPLIVLFLIKERPRNSDEIIKLIKLLTNGIYEPSLDTLAPVLDFLERFVRATVHLEGDKKIYQITDNGMLFLNNNQSYLYDILVALKQSGEKAMANEVLLSQRENLEAKAEQLRAEQLRHMQESDEIKSEFQELRNQLRQALFNKRNASLDVKKLTLAILRGAVDQINTIGNS